MVVDSPSLRTLARPGHRMHQVCGFGMSPPGEAGGLASAGPMAVHEGCVVVPMSGDCSRSGGIDGQSREYGDQPAPASSY